MEDDFEWMSLSRAAVHFGYKHPESLRQRLRKLREEGSVVDIGTPPEQYKPGKADSRKITILWVNSRTPLIRKDAPRGLLVARRGKRRRVSTA